MNEPTMKSSELIGLMVALGFVYSWVSGVGYVVSRIPDQDGAIKCAYFEESKKTLCIYPWEVNDG